MVVVTKNSEYHFVEDDRGIRVRRLDRADHPPRPNKYKQALGDDWHYLAEKPNPVVGEGLTLVFENTEYPLWYATEVMEIKQ